ASHRAAARLSPRTSHRGAAAPLTHPVGLPSSLKVKGIASGGLTATALSPIACGNLRGGMLFVLLRFQ
ncbi:hypothetical protein, partial [Escherichia coli]|uniref:hypothetical protein n=1 Tax=Escherichia coli TaxID=562 RepID=UPI001BAEA953